MVGRFYLAKDAATLLRVVNALIDWRVPDYNYGLDAEGTMSQIRIAFAAVLCVLLLSTTARGAEACFCYFDPPTEGSVTGCVESSRPTGIKETYCTLATCAVVRVEPQSSWQRIDAGKPRCNPCTPVCTKVTVREENK